MKNLNRKLSYTLYTLLVSFLFCSCGVPSDKESKIKERGFNIITIDSCEYIFMSRLPIGGDMALSHKGNCKFCKQRSKK